VNGLPYLPSLFRDEGKQANETANGQDQTGALLRQSLSVSAALTLLVGHAQNYRQMRRMAATAFCSLRHCPPHA